MLSLLNRICRGIEDAWSAGFIQLFVIVILGYTVVIRVVADLDYVKEETRLENKYTIENRTDRTLNVERPPKFDWAESLLDNAPTLIVIGFVIGYEVRRRKILRSRPAVQGGRTPDALAQSPRGQPSKGAVGPWLRLAGLAPWILIGGVLVLLCRLLWRIYAWLVMWVVAWRDPKLADFVSHHQNSATAQTIRNAPFEIAMVMIVMIVFLVLAVWLDVSLKKRRAKQRQG